VGELCAAPCADRCVAVRLVSIRGGPHGTQITGAGESGRPERTDSMRKPINTILPLLKGVKKSGKGSIAPFYTASPPAARPHESPPPVLRLCADWRGCPEVNVLLTAEREKGFLQC